MNKSVTWIKPLIISRRSRHNTPHASTTPVSRAHLRRRQLPKPRNHPPRNHQHIYEHPPRPSAHATEARKGGLTWQARTTRGAQLTARSERLEVDEPERELGLVEDLAGDFERAEEQWEGHGERGNALGWTAGRWISPCPASGAQEAARPATAPLRRPTRSTRLRTRFEITATHSPHSFLLDSCLYIPPVNTVTCQGTNTAPCLITPNQTKSSPERKQTTVQPAAY